ncbi:hypothetical protein [Lawsonibacter sp. JLR.KK007]|jgi:hypothetical protein|uniref:hypothetical protein n=1 Tax=Lawsonibacter sp. JLR.KK007 TaxID=3114293 RepID=UPI002FF04230
MKTIQELEQYLEENCYNFDSITIGRHYAYEGYVVKSCALGYCLFSSERGRETLLKAFPTEEELVAYTLAKLDRNPWYKAHMVAFTLDQKQIKRAEFKLKLMGIRYKRNDIPGYRSGQTAYRIFVYGRDILRLEGFKRQYMRY